MLAIGKIDYWIMVFAIAILGGYAFADYVSDLAGWGYAVFYILLAYFNVWADDLKYTVIRRPRRY